MNSSIYLFLMLLIANPAFSAANSTGDEPIACQKTRVTPQSNNSLENDTISTIPATATRPTPARSARSTAPRTVSPRWHTMLPGMFR